MDRFDPRSLAKKNEGQKIAETKIPEGKGLALGNHPKVMKNITKEENRDLKVIFGVLFGHKKVKLKDVKVLLKKWNGWEINDDEETLNTLEENAANVSHYFTLLFTYSPRCLSGKNTESTQKIVPVSSLYFFCVKHKSKKFSF